MPTHHPDLELVAGDDWVINGTLTNANGSEFDLTGATLYWTLIDVDGLACTDLAAAATVTPQQPLTTGQVTIEIPNSATSNLDPGRYRDALRVISTTNNTLWVGAIDVDANPQAVPSEPI